MLKRARSNSYGSYNQVSQSQGSSSMYRPYSKSSGKVLQKKSFKKVTKADINRAISRRLETKVTVDFGSNQTIVPADVGVPPVTRYLLPILAQGLGQGGRIGNQIHIRSGKICMYLNMNSTSLANLNSPLMVRVWLLTRKEANDNAGPSFTTFFETGNSTVGFQKNMLDMILPVNKNQFTVYFDKTYKIGYGGGLSNVDPNRNNVDDSSFNQRIDIEWAKHFKEPLDYSDIDNVCNNRNLHMVWTAVRADGGAIVSTSDSGAEFHYTNTVKYEDG